MASLAVGNNRQESFCIGKCVLIASLTLFHLCSLCLSVALHLVVSGQIGFIWASGEKVWENYSALEAWAFGL